MLNGRMRLPFSKSVGGSSSSAGSFRVRATLGLMASTFFWTRAASFAGTQKRVCMVRSVSSLLPRA